MISRCIFPRGHGLDGATCYSLHQLPPFSIHYSPQKVALQVAAFLITVIHPPSSKEVAGPQGDVSPWLGEISSFRPSLTEQALERSRGSLPGFSSVPWLQGSSKWARWAPEPETHPALLCWGAGLLRGGISGGSTHHSSSRRGA